MTCKITPYRGGKPLLYIQLNGGEYTLTLTELALTGAVFLLLKLLFRLKYKKRF